MAYPESLKQRARQLADDGLSAEQIANRFSEEVRKRQHDYEPNPKTIRNWLRRGKEPKLHKISVTMKNGRVESIRKDDQHDNWIEAYIKQHKKLPVLPNSFLPVVNYYTMGQPISKNIEVIPASGQYWNQILTNDQREQLLELVEWTGEDVHEYVRHFESMYPLTPNGRG